MLVDPNPQLAEKAAFVLATVSFNQVPRAHRLNAHLLHYTNAMPMHARIACDLLNIYGPVHKIMRNTHSGSHSESSTTSPSAPPAHS